jgi:N-succinyldiaminopimelate aminotransferase
MNPDLDKLHPYPFEKLAQLNAGVEPPASLPPIALSVGEPKHITPEPLAAGVRDRIEQLAVYPTTRGTVELRHAIADWLTARFKLPAESIDAETQILPINGTREALFAIAQAVVDRNGEKPLVLMPNPFYQIYEGAAFLAGAEPRYLDCRSKNGFIPVFDKIDDETWERCQLLYLCSPANPTGAVIDEQTLRKLIGLAHKHNFVIASDECYSEIYGDEENPPVGLLQAAAAMGNLDYRNCVVFHSLSKRSNAPGLRSGFVAGDADIIEPFLLYRTYHGCSMPLHNQAASVWAWGDEAHVRENRRLYRAKFDAMLEILDGVLDVERPQAGFYLWPKTPVSDTGFTRGLLQQQNVAVLPGSYLSREVDGVNPGKNRIRMALVAPLDQCIEAARRIKTHTESLMNL